MFVIATTTQYKAACSSQTRSPSARGAAYEFSFESVAQFYELRSIEKGLYIFILGLVGESRSFNSSLNRISVAVS